MHHRPATLKPPYARALILLSTSAITLLAANEAHTEDFPPTHPNHAGLFVGSTVDASLTPTLGIDYAHHANAFHGLFSLGFAVDTHLGEHADLAATPTLFVHATHALKLGGGVGVETDLAHHTTPLLHSIVEYDIHLSKHALLSPTLTADYDVLWHSARVALGVTAAAVF